MRFLLVRSGLFRYKIPLAQISEVRPSAEALFSFPATPAWSLDRLKVVYPTRSGFHRSLLISPRDRDGFLDELARRANHLERDGSSLLRKDHPRPPEAGL
jgi:Bacterial PH domain